MIRTIREMVGAAPVCPPERPRSGVSMRKRHIHTRKGGVSMRKRHIHIRKGGVSICKRHIHIRKSVVSIHKQCLLTPKHVCVFADGCALMGRRGRAHRHSPYQLHQTHLPAIISHVCPSAEALLATLRPGAIREMVGAAPVCPPEHPRSGVSMRKGHVPTRKEGISSPAKEAFPSAKGASPSVKEAFPSVKSTLHPQKRHFHS